MGGSALTAELLNRRAVHPFPARMAANIPWEILSPCGGCLRVLDPMAGSGTSLIAGRAAGHATYGVDSDPLAVLIARVGTADAKEARIEEHGREDPASDRMMETGADAKSTSARQDDLSSITP